MSGLRLRRWPPRWRTPDDVFLPLVLALGLVPPLLAEWQAVPGQDAPTPARPVDLGAFPRLALRESERPTLRIFAASQTIASAPIAAIAAVGTIRVGRTTAVLVRGTDGAIRRVTAGGQIEGWQLVALDDDRARFRRGFGRLDLPLPTARPLSGRARPGGLDSENDRDN